MDRIFAKDVLPWLGHFDIFDVDNTHLLDVLRRIERRLRHNLASDLDIVAAPSPARSSHAITAATHWPIGLTS